MINDTSYNDACIYLKSSNYTSKISESNLMFDLNTPIIVQPNVDILIRLDTFQFTNCFYTINTNNQYFYWTISGGIKQTASLTNGFYNIDDIVVLLNATVSGLVFSWDYYKYTIKITSVNSFIISDGISNIYNLLGFDSYGTLTYDTSFTSPYLFNTMNVQQIKICVPNININSIEKKFDRKDNILYALRVNVGPGEIQNFFNVSTFYYKLYDTNITSLQVMLLDQNDNLIQFNGIEWFLSVNITYQYKKTLIPAHTLIDHYNTYQNEYENSAIEVAEEALTKQKNQVLDEIIYRNKLLLKKNI